MKRLLILTTALSIALFSCNMRPKTAEITDIMGAEDIAAMTPDAVIEDLLPEMW